MFFQCDTAYDVWRQIGLLIQQLMPGKKVQYLKLALGIRPADIKDQNVNLITTLIQLTMYSIWTYRNKATFERLVPNVAGTVKEIFQNFKRIIQAAYRKAVKTNTVANFRKQFCTENSLITLGTDLHINFPCWRDIIWAFPP